MRFMPGSPKPRAPPSRGRGRTMAATPGQEDGGSEQERGLEPCPLEEPGHRLARGGFRKTKAATSPAGRRFRAQIHAA